MTQFTIVQEDEATDPQVQAVYDEIKTELGFGMVPNLFKSMAHHPGFLYANWNKFRAVVLQGSLPRTLKEMIGVAISQANDSQYALNVHLHGLSALGISEEVLKLLVSDFENCPLPEREKAVISFGLKAATDPHGLSAADYEGLYQQGLSSKEVFEILATSNLFTGVNQYTDAISLEIDAL
ncbi:MAG TPA: peroxidase-related enzyme [Anaerolineae bacterium]|nr:peroxidase-related enzyme [Anaerolineae bacterium]